MQDFCIWCHKLIKAPKNYDPKKHKLVCSWSCWHAEMYFSLYWSDEEQTMRKYWRDVK